MKILTNNPISAAADLHNKLGWTNPEDFTLIEIANTLGVAVKDEQIKGSEGRILIMGQSGIISINSNITHPGRRNFIVAHEIGHFILHKNVHPFFSDTHRTLSDWYRNGAHEVEANTFAAELLMPGELFKRMVKGKKLSIELINQTSAYFHTSLTATFLRYITHGDYPLMVLFFEGGKARWRHCTTDFPFQYFEYGAYIPVDTVTGDVFYKNATESEPVKIKAMEWFPDNYKLKYDPQMNLWEQCYKVSENGLITCLWTQ
jgi:Zn-dependent peptidase ImmA (M78 family)